MKTIIPDVAALIDNVNAQLDTMLDLTGGDCGRDFTVMEGTAWDKLITIRSHLHTIQDLRLRDGFEEPAANARVIRMGVQTRRE
jgi:hypothetical protein